MSSSEKEIFLSRPELLYLLNAFGSRHVVGLKLDEFGWSQQRLAQFLDEGKQILIARSLLTETENFPADDILADMIRVIAFRSIALLLVRGVKGRGQQLYIFNHYQNRIVEHTMPEDGMHRLMEIQNPEELILRLANLIPLQSVLLEHKIQFEVSQQEFEEIVNNSKLDAKKARILSFLETQGLSIEHASMFIEALISPELTISLACLAIDNDEAYEAQSVAIFADQDSSWGVWPMDMPADPPKLEVYPTGINHIVPFIELWLSANKVN
jgi:hypothetical protein